MKDKIMTVRVDTETLEWLKQEAKLTDIPVSQIVRQAIKQLKESK